MTVERYHKTKDTHSPLHSLQQSCRGLENILDSAILSLDYACLRFHGDDLYDSNYFNQLAFPYVRHFSLPIENCCVWDPLIDRIGDSFGMPNDAHDAPIQRT